MKLALRGLIASTCLILALAVPLGASAKPTSVSSYDISKNLHPIGEYLNPNIGGVVNTDLAFWGDRAYQGTYNGFNIIDISEPGDPVEIVDYNECAMDVNGAPSTSGGQGDVVVWGDILVRSWNGATSTNPLNPRFCDGDQLPPSFEGLNIFDISNPLDPDHIALVDLQCGSHTATGVPDLANNRLLIYNGSSSGQCEFVDIIEIPLNNPAGARVINSVSTVPEGEEDGHPCHDIGVVLGDAMRMGCAGGPGVSVFSMRAEDGGSLAAPELMHHVEVPGVSIGHTAAWTWDGEVLIFGHEPGGGTSPRCQATSSITDRTIWFFDEELNELGSLVLPRIQSAAENCTWHNLNVVPLRDKQGENRYVYVSGNYQAGISVVDFSDPANAQQIAYADPAPLVPEFDGGDWSTYWYNGFIYESDITRGLLVWKLSDPAVAGALKLDHLNPQTNEFTID